MAVAESILRARNAVAAGALSWARSGDWNDLADHIERGGTITGEIRNFLVAVLRRELIAPNNRAPTRQKHRESRDRAELVLSAMAAGKGREEAKDEAASVTGKNRRTIDRDLERHEAGLRPLLEIRPILRRYREFLVSQPPAELRREYLEWCGSERPVCWKLILRYWVSPAALSQHFMS
jgi:hypothetical protein